MKRAGLAAVVVVGWLFAGCAGGGDIDGGVGADAGAEDGGAAGGPFVVAVVSFTPGEGAGFGEEALPEIVQGPPVGFGDAAGSTDVLSLGRGGSVVVELGEDITDGAGDDFVVFENAFAFGNGMFTEPGEVAVSLDGESFETFACDAESGAGCAGQLPVFSHPDNDIAPLSEDAGGDRFDLAEVGLTRARFVRIVDVGDAAIPTDTDNNGFDLDAIGVLPSSP